MGDGQYYKDVNRPKDIPYYNMCASVDSCATMDGFTTTICKDGRLFTSTMCQDGCSFTTKIC